MLGSPPANKKERKNMDAKNRKYKDELMVLRTQSENPKKPGSKSRERFGKYPKTMVSVGEVLKIEGGPTRADLDWDKKHGFIFIGTKEELAAMSKVR